MLKYLCLYCIFSWCDSSPTTPDQVPSPVHRRAQPSYTVDRPPTPHPSYTIQQQRRLIELYDLDVTIPQAQALADEYFQGDIYRALQWLAMQHSDRDPTPEWALREDEED